jgi:hypothetical protein
VAKAALADWIFIATQDLAVVEGAAKKAVKQLKTVVVFLADLHALGNVLRETS